MEKTLNRGQVCDMLKISKMTLYRYMRDGKIPYFKFGNAQSSRVLFREIDIIEYVKKSYKG